MKNKKIAYLVPTDFLIDAFIVVYKEEGFIEAIKYCWGKLTRRSGKLKS